MDDLTVGNSLNIGEIISTYGFPIIAAAAMGYFIFFIWKYVTTQIKPKLGQAFGVLVELIDRVRMLDNDLIRLEQKLNVFVELKEELQLEELEGIKHDKQKK